MKRLFLVGTVVLFFLNCGFFNPASVYANGGWGAFTAGLFTGGCLGLSFKDPYKQPPSDYIKSGEYKKRYQSGRWHKHNHRYIYGNCEKCHFKKKKKHDEKKIIIIPSDNDSIIIIKKNDNHNGW